MPRARVVIAVNTSWNIVNFRAGLVRALVANGYEVVAVAPRDEYSTHLARLGCRYVSLAMDNKGTSPRRDIALTFRFMRLLWREQPDIYLGFTIKPNVYGSLAAHALGIPTINNIAGLGTAFIRATWLTQLVKTLYRAALARSHTVFFQNEDDRTLFLEDRLVRREKTALVPGSGVELSRFRPRAAETADGDFRFLLIGRLLWDKGIREFVEAARIVRRRSPRTRFQLLGFLDVENRTAISRETVDGWIREGIIEYLGAADDVREHIARADCVVLPSYREGTPRSLLEGAAMAKPLIATDVPGCRQVVDAGENGLLCVSGDASSLAARMLEMLQMSRDQRLAMGAASRAKVEREFDERVVIGRYHAAIEAVLSDGRPGTIRARASVPVAAHRSVHTVERPLRGRGA
jgi:glycosyltransferase involved in cell wall biosynthesis